MRGLVELSRGKRVEDDCKRDLKFRNKDSGDYHETGMMAHSTNFNKIEEKSQIIRHIMLLKKI